LSLTAGSCEDAVICLLVQVNPGMLVIEQQMLYYKTSFTSKIIVKNYFQAYHTNRLYVALRKGKLSLVQLSLTAGLCEEALKCLPSTIGE